MADIASFQHTSPYASAARDLVALGWHAIPIIPPTEAHGGAGKMPGELRAGSWYGMSEWQRFRDRRPTEFELELWSRSFTGSNVGLVMGSPAGDGLQTMSVDIDAEDTHEIDVLRAALPDTPMAKRGAKGLTLFYRSPPIIRSKPYDLPTPDGKRRRVVDLLTGHDTRQTVVPPSLHKSGAIYVWLGPIVAPADLPVFDEDALARLEAALSSLGWAPKAARPESGAPASGGREIAPYVPTGDVDIWSETKGAAMADLGRWVGALPLYGLRPARRGFEAVATWRSSGTGKPTHERKHNLSIQPSGIKDFGTDETYSPIDLVMAALNVDDGQAMIWLRERVGLADPAIFSPDRTQAVAILQGAVPAVVEIEEEDGDYFEFEEMPAALLDCPGLVGDITQWILDTSTSPLPAASLGAALTFLGTLQGRVYGGPTDSGTHLYAVGVAPSGAGKNHPLDRVKKLLMWIDADDLRGGSQFMSMSAVYQQLQLQPCQLVVADEVGNLLGRQNSANASGHEKGISGVMRTIWGESFGVVDVPRWAASKGVSTNSSSIVSPAVSILGATVVSEFFDAMASSDVSNGFLNRWTLFATRVSPVKVSACAPKSAPAELVARLKRFHETAHTMRCMNNAAEPIVRVPWDDDGAQAVFDDLVVQCEQFSIRDETSLEAMLHKRTAEIALRMATIRAVGRNPDKPALDEGDMRWGRALSLWCTNNMIVEARNRVAEGLFDVAMNKMRVIFERLGTGVWHTRRAVLVAGGKRMEPRLRDQVLSTLEECGEIERRSKGDQRGKKGADPLVEYMFTPPKARRRT